MSWAEISIDGERHRIATLAGNDADSMLIDIYLDGMGAGAQLALSNYTDAELEHTKHVVSDLLRETVHDPLAIETIRQHISRRLTRAMPDDDEGQS